MKNVVRRCQRGMAFILAFALVLTGMLQAGITEAKAATGTFAFSESAGYGEGAYAEWAPVEGADGYKAYVSSDGGTYKAIDNELIREYANYWRVDVLGLRAGTYYIKVEAVTIDEATKAATAIAEGTTGALKVTAHDRSGFGWINGTSSGAYNEDGTLKSNANVIYVTEATKDTVTLTVTTSSKGATTECIGLQNIIYGYKKGYETKPLCVRMIGNVTDLATLDKGDIVIDGCTAGLTFEGIGEDTVANGWGLRIKGSSNVEVRNIGFMNCNSEEGDNLGLQQDNNHIWVHNCDFFYGDAGSDADQAKGDGALDTKKSTYVTHSYNHFWDSGKCNLQGMKDETTENYITYHHNWYDHSDSRHPRIRTCTVHIYNNYFDGNSKYGVGVTMGASAFVENNYFRNCKYPMLSSNQGTDALGEGTFGDEAGGIIKAFNNIVVGDDGLIYADANNITSDSDAYLVTTRTETVPSTYVTKLGGTAYNNFDTQKDLGVELSDIDAAEDVPTVVMAKAGRVNGGDFDWTFDSSDDISYAVDTELKAALTNYKSSIVSIGGIDGVTDSGENGGESGGESGGENGGESNVPNEGSTVHNFTTDGKTSTFYTITGNMNSKPGTVTFNGLTLTQCLKMESSTSIKFNAAQAGKMTMVFDSTFSGEVKLDGTKTSSAKAGVLTFDIKAGAHEITKDDSTNLYYMVIVYADGTTGGDDSGNDDGDNGGKPGDEPGGDETDTTKNGLIQTEDGNWYLYKEGVVDTTYTGFYNDAVCGWWLVEGGKVNFNYSGLYNDAACGWWLVTNGAIDFGYTGLYNDANVGWWLVMGGRLCFEHTGLYNDANVGWWLVMGGRVCFEYTGLYGDAACGWWLVEGGTINFGYTGLYNDAACGWWLVEGGTINFGYTGLYYDVNVGWWYIEGGAINFGYTGLVYYGNNWWYVQGGSLNFGYSGPVVYNGITYTVVGGMVVG